MRISFLIVFFIGISAKANLLVLNFNGNTTTVRLANDYANKNASQIFVYPNHYIKEINKDTIHIILQEVNSKNIDTVIFSGHSGFSFFSGKDGILSRRDFIEAANAYPEFKNNVTAVYGRGCYTATKADFFGSTSWLELFPNLNFLAGYEGKAWSSETPQSQSFIRDLLHLKEDFLNSQSKEDIIATYKSFERYYDSEAAVWIKQADAVYYVSTIQLLNREPVINFIEVANACQSLSARAQVISDEIKKYFLGVEESYQRPPSNSSTGPLRTHYSWLLQNQHCRLIEAWENKREIHPHFVMSLLFYDKLAANFSLNFNLIEFERSLEWLDSVSGKQFLLPDITQSSRAEIRNFSLELMSVVTNANSVDGLREQLGTFEFKLLQYYSEAFHKIISELYSQHIPFRWLTEDVSNDQPMGFIYPSRNALPFRFN